MLFCVFISWWASCVFIPRLPTSFCFRNVAFFFCNVAFFFSFFFATLHLFFFEAFPHPYRFFQLRTVPSETSSFLAISTIAIPSLNSFSACVTFSLGALGISPPLSCSFCNRGRTKGRVYALPCVTLTNIYCFNIKSSL